jgi:hypothetical protein
LSNLIANSPSTSHQRKVLKNFHIDTHENITFGEASNLIDQNKPATLEEKLTLLKLYGKNLVIPESMSTRQAQLLIENAK